MIDTADEFFALQSIRQSYSIQPLEPIQIGSQRQLMIDDRLIDDCWNCRRTVHQPKKHDRNPLIAPSTPARGRGMPFTSVLYDPDQGCFKLWGSAHPFEGSGMPYHCLYFESEDGLEWSSPSLGKVPLEGSTSNNIFRSSSAGRALESLAVIRMPEGWGHKGRYAMVYDSCNIDSYLVNAQARVDLAFSDDGIIWTDQAENPVLAAQSDTHNNLVYVPDREAFILYHRPTISGLYNRRIAMMESKDLVTWTQPNTILFPDELDPPHLYGMTVDRYQGLYLGFLMVYYRSDISDHPAREFANNRAWPEFPKELQMENQLAWSRDGINWSRHPARPTFLETGRRYSAYDWAFARKGTGIVEMGDELYLYYQGADRIKKTDYTDRSGYWHLCLATIRKDGFVSLDSQGDGFVLTVPVECPGGRLHINAQTKSGGRIRVAVRRGDGARDGEAVDDRAFQDSVEFTGDSTDHVMEWRVGGNQDQLKGQSVRFHFWLNDASLYSYWFE